MIVLNQILTDLANGADHDDAMTLDQSYVIWRSVIIDATSVGTTEIIPIINNAHEEYSTMKFIPHMAYVLASAVTGTGTLPTISVGSNVAADNFCATQSVPNAEVSLMTLATLSLVDIFTNPLNIKVATPATLGFTQFDIQVIISAIMVTA